MWLSYHRAVTMLNCFCNKITVTNSLDIQGQDLSWRHYQYTKVYEGYAVVVTTGGNFDIGLSVLSIERTWIEIMLIV